MTTSAVNVFKELEIPEQCNYLSYHVGNIIRYMIMPQWNDVKLDIIL